MSSPMIELPEHFPIGVNAIGMGPVMEHERDFDHYECWCMDKECQLFRIFLEGEDNVGTQGT